MEAQTRPCLLIFQFSFLSWNTFFTRKKKKQHAFDLFSLVNAKVSGIQHNEWYIDTYSEPSFCYLLHSYQLTSQNEFLAKARGKKR